MTGAFHHPEWLWAAVAGVAGCAALLVLARRRHEGRRARLLGVARRFPFQASEALLVGALACIALALLGPLVGTERVRLPATGIDVVLLIDVSRSMRASDTPPSRLARARRAAERTLAGLRPGDRAALAVFAGQGAALTPLTPDRTALLDLLPYVDTTLSSDGSSRLASGLQAALQAFDPESVRPRRLLLLSDGEHAGDVPAALLAELRRAGVRVVAGAIGSDAGAPVPGASGQPVRHANGRPVTSRRDVAALERIAAGTGGRALPGDVFGDFAPGRLVEALSAGAVPAGDGSVEQEVPLRRTRLPAALAALLLGVELLRRESREPPRLRMRGWAATWRRSARGARRAQTAAALALALLLLGADDADDDAAHLEARLRASPEDARLLLEVGVARAREGRMREAERAFLAASLRSGDADLAALAYYDLGVALLTRGHYEGARDAFLDALAFDPAHEDARFNLAWTLRALAAGAPPDAGDRDTGEGEPEAGEDERRTRKPPPRDARDAATPGSEDPDRGRDARPPRAAELDAEEAMRWLDSVQDDPSRALRGRLDAGGRPGARRGPAW